MSFEALQTLCEVRLAAERQAERELARASAAVRAAREEQARLAEAVAAARARRGTPEGSLTPTSAGVLQTAARYLARLDAELAAAARAAGDHARGPLAAAVEVEAQARDQHARARARREVVQRAIERRQAARRREQDRRAEADADDLAQRGPSGRRP
ncbi:MAG: hypothetical protein ACJ8F1_13460 [Polyangia bacterium]